MSLSDIRQLLQAAGSDWLEDRAPRLGAALAYYTVFSLAPLILMAVAIAGFIFGEDAARGQVAEQIQSLVGREGALAIQEMLAASSQSASGIIATVVSIIVLIFGAVAVFGELQDALNQIWDVPESPSMGWLEMLRARMLTFVMIFVVAGLLLAVIITSTVLNAAFNWFGDRQLPWLVRLSDTAITFFALASLFAVIYKILPNARIAWRDVLFGATVTAVLFLLGKHLLAWYLGRGTFSSAFGAAGSLAVLLVWLYYSAQVFYFGAELTHQYACHFGSNSPRTQCPPETITPGKNE